MSLKTQLYSLIVGLVLLAFASALYTNLAGLQRYQQQQLASHAQDAATHLGLTISPHLQDNDFIMVETLASAMFDAGYYQMLRYDDIHGNSFLSRTHQPVPLAVPEWFSSLFPLTPPIMFSDVSDGWKQHGTLWVQSHPGMGYNALWQQAKHLSFSMVLLLFIALLASYVFLSLILKPLQAIQQQAAAVMQKQFTENDSKPVSSELRLLVKALNKMVANLGRTFNEQNNHAETLTAQLYLDPLTGLKNRLAFQEQFASLQQQAQQSGDPLAIILIALPSLAHINNRDGYPAGDAYVQEAGAILTRLLPNNETVLYRLSGSEFAILSAAGQSSVGDLLLRLQHVQDSYAIEQYPQGFAQFSHAWVNEKDTLAMCLTHLDNTKTLAPSQTTLPVSGMYFNRSEWRTLLKPYTDISALNQPANSSAFLNAVKSLNSLFACSVQPVANLGGQLMYLECFIRFCYQQQPLPTAETFAMAEQLQLSMALERSVLSFALFQLSELTDENLALNLSTHFIKDPEQQTWLLQVLDLLKPQLPNLLLEINEAAFLHAEDHLHNFVNALKKRNVSVVIDHFGANLKSFQYIRNLNVDFVKLDPALTQQLSDEKNRYLVQSLIQICHAIGIKVLAACIEQPQNMLYCKNLLIDGIQGRLIAKEQNLTTNFVETQCKDIRTELELSIIKLLNVR